MSEPDYKGRALLPMPVIEAARAGDAEAVECVLRYYDRCLNRGWVISWQGMRK